MSTPAGSSGKNPEGKRDFANEPLTPDEVNAVHRYSDKDNNTESQHHSLGRAPEQASPGDHTHDGKESAVLTRYLNTSDAAPSVTGARGGNVALANLLSALASQGIIADNTTA